MTSRSLKICALVAIAPYFSTYHSTLSSPSRCDTSHERAESPGEWCPSRSLSHCSHTSVLGAVTRTSDLQALCRAVLEEAALCVVVGARCAGSSCETSQLGPLVLFSPAGPQAAVSPRFCDPSHHLACAVAHVSSFFSQLPHTQPSSSS